MADENVKDLLDSVTDRISTDVIKAMSKDLAAPSEYAEPLRNILFLKIRDTLSKRGFEERYNQRLDSAVYKEDVKNEYDYFLAGGIRLPEEVNYTSALRPVIEDFTNNIEQYLTSSEYRVERNISDDPTVETNYIEWVKQYRANRNDNLQKDSLWFDTAAYDVEKGYANIPAFIVTNENTFNVGLKEPSAPQTFTFGDETKSTMYDMTRKEMVGHGPVKTAKAFDDVIGSRFMGESGLENPDVKADYKHFINCFSIDGHNLDYRETGDKKLDEENLKEAKIAIVHALTSKRSVEFTSFTMDAEGKCHVENIPLAHANAAKNKDKMQHINGPAALRAAKLAQKITEKARKEAERKHKNYLAQEKREESAKRKRVTDEYNRKIRNAQTRDEKNALKSELKALKDKYKKVDREVKARQKAAETARKNQLKVENRKQKAYIKQLTNEVKAVVKQQKAEAKLREQREKADLAQRKKEEAETIAYRKEQERKEREEYRAKQEARQAEAAHAAENKQRVKLSEANEEKQVELNEQVAGTTPKTKVSDPKTSQTQTLGKNASTPKTTNK